MIARRASTLLIWFGCVALAALVVVRARYVTDLSAFLPSKPTPAQQLLVDQLRDGPASRLILLAIEGGDADSRAKLSLGMVEQLRHDRRFLSVNNGAALSGSGDREFLFHNRYLLSETATAERFSVPGLHAAIGNTIDELASPAGLLLKSLLPRDPTGETFSIIDQLARLPAPASRDGVWVSADGTRALGLAQTAASGSDSDAQSAAIDAMRAAFAAAQRASPQGAARHAQLRLSGPGVFAVATRAKIERAAIRLSAVGSVLVVTLLLTVYRSLAALGLGLLPVATGALIGVAAVAVGFGAVHAITLGFGITLIGESVDYSIYFFIQSRRRAQSAVANGWGEGWWPTIRLGMLTSVCGFASLLPSGFPGLAQLGLYSISGLIAAALVTRFVLPALLPPKFAIRDLTPVGLVLAGMLHKTRRIGRTGTLLTGAALAIGALAVLYHLRGTLWNRELAALSPISIEEQDLDASLRADLGAADVRDLVIVSGSDLESVLQAAERTGIILQGLVNENVIGGFESPANFLPSMRTQEARRSSLPAAEQMSANLRQATAGLPLDAERLHPFLDDVEAARHAPPLTAHDLRGTSFAAGFDALILHQKNQWNGMMPLRDVAPGQPIDLGRVRAAIEAGEPGEARVLDLKQESDALYSTYLTQALRYSVAGFAALALLLLIALRSPLRVARVLAPLVLSVLIVAAVLAACGVPLNILHLVGMLLIVAVGSNYALFFDRQAQSAQADEALTAASLVIANASTVIGFGLLCFSRIPVLVALGTTVAPGTWLALLFAGVGARAGIGAHEKMRDA
ncbi:MAG TPA: MMPL family transporter [Steroidobacteraceae bacterium]